VTRIENGTFKGCINLISVTLPAGVEYVGSDVFYLCQNLRTINFGGTMAQWNAMVRMDNWKESVTNFDVVCLDGVIEAYMVV
jgi:hypothetical protein